MNFLIVASKQDPAGMNIINNLNKLKSKIQSLIAENDVLHTENLDLNKINSFDFIIFASRHKSKKEEKALTVHAPGNFGDADFGGERKKLCPTSASFMKQIFQELNNQQKACNLNEYQVTLEATHHGPLIDKPCIFIEIGATEVEWKDSRAGIAVAKAIINTIIRFKHNSYKFCIGIGGQHYCPNFNKIQLSSDFALSHILPQYALPADETILKEAIYKTIEKIEFILIDWKGIGNSEQRNQLIKLINDIGLPYKKIDRIKTWNKI